MKKIILILLAFIGTLSTFGQRNCASHSHLQDQLLANPAMQSNLNAINQHAIQYANGGKKARALVTIPVVFHVIYNTPAQNISDAACIANLSQLNLDFARLNADAVNTPAAFAPLAANTDIQFCLAVRDPLGNTTTGITHTASTITSWSTNNNVKFAASGGVDAWPRDQYLNVWVCNLGSSLLGYGQFPGGTAATDGIVVLYTSVGSQASPNPAGGNYALGRTATHEVGHWLNLRHIWGDDGGACTGDDLVGDTPNCADDNGGCPTYPLLDACATVAPGVMFMNYMDYVNDNCMNMFSAGQGTRMAALFAPGGFRAPLLTSLGCTSVLPCAGIPNAGTISTNVDTICSGNAQLTLSGSSSGAGISVQWESATSLAGPWVNAIGNSNNLTYSAQPSSGVMYYRCVIFCAASGQSAITNIIPIYSTGVVSVSGAAGLCAQGNVTLIATGIGTFNWYTSAVATVPLFTGNPFNIFIPNNTTLYVNTGSSAKYSVGPINKSIGTNSVSNTMTNGLYFRVLSPFTIDTVFVYPDAAGTVVINVQDSITGTSIGVFSMPVTAAQINTKVAMPINITCSAVGSYKMIGTGTNIGLYRNTNGAVFPYTIPGVVSIIRCVAGNNPTTTYRYFYDWKISAGCATARVAVPIVITAPILTASHTAIICNGAFTTITASTTGVGYNYSLNGGASNTTGIFNNVLAGTYTISAANASGCTTSSVYTIAQPAAMVLSVASINNTSACNGSLTASAVGGFGAIQYQLNGSAYQANGAFTNLCTGLYTICSKDANNCVQCTTAIVNSLTNIAVYVALTASCNASNNGSITTTHVGGVAPYQYKLNTGAYGGANVFSNLAAGSYTITVKDVNNVTSTILATITNSTLAINATGTSAASATACNGSITGLASGGSPSYTYSLNGAAYVANGNYTNLCSGNYTICVNDALGCVVCTNYTVLIIVPIAMLSPTLTQPCAGTNNGSITAIAQFGTVPYLYQLNGGAFGASATFNNLVGGIYTITAIDANSITTSTIVNLNKSTNLTLNTIGKTDMSCFNTCNGNIGTIATNGASAYSYTLNGGTSQANGVFGNLCNGVYTIICKDANNCTTSVVLSITSPPAIDITLAATNIACYGMTNGSVLVNAIGGSSPYQYTKLPSPYGTFNIFNGLAAGTYTFKLKDANNCSISDTTSVIEPPVLSLIGVTNANASSITINASGGTPTYTYSINGGATTSNNVFNGLGAGTYSLQVTDSKGCQYVTAVVLKAPESIADLQLQKAIGVYPNPSNGIINIAINSNNTIGVLQIKVMNTLGQIVAKDFMTVNSKVGEKIVNLQHIPMGTYMIQIVDEHQSASIHRIVIR
jgi:Pregnancy-associated plasma protein-A/Secretion system C-terminal sorting domain/SprB repeat